MGPKIPDFRILGLEFENIIVIFYISVLGFGLLQSLVQKLKSLNLGPKYLISTSSNLPNCTISPKKQELQKIYHQIWNQHPQICVTANTCGKKSLNLGQKMPYLGIFRLESRRAIVMFEISTLQFVSLPNFTKNKNH